MRSVAGGFVLAVALFAAAFLFWQEARQVRRMAGARQRLATVHYDAEDGLPEGRTALNRLPLSTLDEQVGRHRATVAYWREKYRELAGRLPSAGGNNAESTTDPAIMLLGANASFRASQADMSDRGATVERLDRVIQAYADVLRAAPGDADASYNYEFVTRFRDTFAKAKPPRRGEKPAPPEQADASPDLPIGPTIHGRPGGPPPDVPMEKFRTVTPMRFEEREEMDPGQGPPPRRRG
jgi:hypothetical protein